MTKTQSFFPQSTTKVSAWPTVDEIAAKRQRGEFLTPWESSVYRLNFRDDGTRYSSDPVERAAQYDADNAKAVR